MIRRLFLQRPGSFLIAASVLLGGCAADRENGGAVEGELLIGIKGEEENLEHVYILRTGGPSRQDPELLFNYHPALRAGTPLRVWGVAEGNKLWVSRYEVVSESDGEGRIEQALINPTPKSIGAAIAIVDIGGGSPNLTLEQARARMFGEMPSGRTDTSLRHFYAENSYGGLNVSGDAYGPFRYAMNGCDYNGLEDAVQPEIQKAAGKSFDKYVYYMGTNQKACAWSGLGGGDTCWLNASISCVVLNHEFGHALGLPHASTMTCGGVEGAFPDNLSSCTHNEYGSKHTPMGSACQHMNGWEKWREGWLESCNGVKVRASGTFTIYPLELPCNGVQVLQVPMAKQRPGPGSENDVSLTHYYVDLRSAFGLDSNMTTPQVMVSAAQDVEPIVGGRGGIGRGGRAWTIDANPEARNDRATASGWGIPAGGTFRDPAGGVTITVQSLEATRAVVNIEITSSTVPNAMGTSQCADKSTFVAPGPAECLASVARPGGGGAGGMLGQGGAPVSGGTGGTAGFAGSGGIAGVGGTMSNAGGVAGVGGGVTSGTGGSPAASGANPGGSSGASGAAGSAGAAQGGVFGSAGGSAAAGTGGSSGSGGSMLPIVGGTSTGGSSGAPPTISAGTGPSAAGGGVWVPPGASDSEAGCGCRTPPSAPAGSWSLATLGLALAIFNRRMRRRKREGPGGIASGS